MNINEKKTISSIFIAPTLGISIKKLKQHGYISAYGKYASEDNIYADIDDVVYLLFKPNDLSLFKKLVEDEYERTSLIVDDFNYDEDHVIIIYSLHPKFNKDYLLIKKGKYSKTSKEFQSLFPEYVYIVENSQEVKEHSLQYLIFNKHPYLIHYWEEKIGLQIDPSQEVWGAYDEETETLKIKSYGDK